MHVNNYATLREYGIVIGADKVKSLLNDQFVPFARVGCAGIDIDGLRIVLTGFYGYDFACGMFVVYKDNHSCPYIFLLRTA